MLTRKDLDPLLCSNPECKDPNCSRELFLHSHCHPEHVPTACYIKATGSLKFTCSVCDKHVLEVLVATDIYH